MLKVVRVGWCALLAVLAVPALVPSGQAIVIDMVDDFQTGSLSNWRIGGAYQGPEIVSDAGPLGAGDFALRIESSNDFIKPPRLLVYNQSQWAGDWTAAGIERVTMDVRNPSSFHLTMRFALAGDGGFFSQGGGDTYVTDGVLVPNDDAWHTITFDVTSAGFHPYGGEDIAGALENVSAVRILHNTQVDTKGATVAGSFLVDNIHAHGAVVGIAGDYNGNGVVDAADYTVWRDSRGATGTGLPADGTGPGGAPDGVVDDLDYTFWKSNFGEPGGGHHHAVTAAVVPEPATLLILTLGLFAAPVRRRPFDRCRCEERC